ncbi:MAG: N-acetylmuramoyl-L-alanine amidase [Rikenellaceae bacterium]|nr:N-acetylmuramoyl-L-alanine amidase [Rikenellaceae bacterium]
MVIDAGHGGKDPGAVGNGQQEKAINLGVALRLGRMIGEQLPDVKVVYTRKDDRFIPLADRSKIAAKAGADLFISIHTNSSPSREAAGTETYVMGEDKGNRNLSVVMRENSVISLEADYTSRYEGYDPNSSESLILFSLMQYAYQSQSLSLAELIQAQYAGHAQRRDKGVKQAGFLVLWRTPMPSVLTEVGFISNPAEAKFLGSAAGQEKIAAAIFRAVKEYKRRTDSRTLATGPAQEAAPKAERAAPGSAAGQAAEAGTENAEKVMFRIQVKSSLSKIPVTRSNFGDYAEGVLEKRIDGRYKYYYGSSFSYQEALLLQRRVRRSFPDAFMVAFRGGRPVPLADAIKK